MTRPPFRLASGDFTVRFTPPAGSTPTGTDVGRDDVPVSDIDGSGLTGGVHISTAKTDLTADASFIPPGSVPVASTS